MQRIYYRDDSGFIETRDAKDWTKEGYLRAHPTLSFASRESLMGWSDDLVQWYATGGDKCSTVRAVGFPVERPE